ncbi:MAG: SMP-30/gluconolactonase/LRE family protein, partial [Vicinamibacterales bacterium]|nr:SMP-30/gluconolactonase/LRE family protein [Vicinamibacterales bacterium]
MKHHVLRLSLFAAALVAGAISLQASAPRFWQASTQADLLKGDAEQVSIDEFGRLVLGPDLRAVHDTSVPFVWCLAAAPDGGVFAGTGNDGQVLRIDRQGNARVWFDAAELEVHAMVSAADGTLYAATSPDGRVYRIDPTGTSRVYVDPDEKYIWSLALDGQGRLFVGTGERGRVYRVEADGTVKPFYTPTSTHVTALALDSQGRLIVGTDSPGRVIRVDRDGHAFVLYDSPYREIRALRVDATGRIFAAAVNGKPAPEAAAPTQPSQDPARGAPVASVSSEITAVTVLDMPMVTGGPAPSPGRDSSSTPKGSVLVIATDGSVEAIWESREDIPFDILPDGPDGVLITSGNGGRIYRASGHPSRATLVTRVNGKQATAIVSVGQTRYVATANPGRIVSLGTGRAAQGTYTSEVKDAGTMAQWGALSWRAAGEGIGRVQVYTRSGNTAVTDDGWSPWAGPYERTDDAVRSPGARYLQWKAVISGGAASGPPPMLASLSIAYLQRNIRPRVTDITVHPPGVVFQRPYPTGEPEIAGLDSTLPEYRFPVYSMPLGTPSFRGASPALGRRLYQKGLQAFAWKAEDANDDRMVYDVHFRRVGDGDWRPLRTGTLDDLLVWDTTSVPDGAYVIRVTASDRLANVPSASLAGETQSQAFDIDNTPPAVSITSLKAEPARTVVTFDVTDGHSVIERVEYSVDAGPWRTAYPADGAADA